MTGLVAICFTLVLCCIWTVNAGSCVSQTLVAAKPRSYNTRIGGGSLFDNVRSLAGGTDVSCYDVVTHFVILEVTNNKAPADTCMKVQLSMTADATGSSGVAYTDILYTGIQFGNLSNIENGALPFCAAGCYGGGQTISCPATCNCTGRGVGQYGYDCYYKGNYDETVTVLVGPKFVDKTGAPSYPYGPNSPVLLFVLQVCGLQKSEAIPVRFDLVLDCRTPGNWSPSGVLQAQVDDASSADGCVQASGQQTVPVKSLSSISQPCKVTLNVTIYTNDFNATVSVYSPSFNGGSFDMLLWYSWSSSIYKTQTIGVVNRTSVNTFQPCAYHTGQSLFSQATCGCAVTWIDNTQPQLFFNVNSTYYNPRPTYEVITIPTGTFQVYHYVRISNDSQVTDLYIDISNNQTIRKAVFVDGTVWIFKNYIGGQQPANTFALAGGSNTTQCNCKKKLDVMFVAQRDQQISGDEFSAMQKLMGTNLPAYTSTCGAPNNTFGFINAAGTCISGVNFGLTIYDTKPEVLLGFTGGVRGTNPTQVYNVVNGAITTQFNGKYPCQTTNANDPCGQNTAGNGDLAGAIILAAQNLAQSDRTSAPKIIVLVNQGFGNSNQSALANAINVAMTTYGVSQIFSVTFGADKPQSQLVWMVNDPQNLVYRNVPADLTIVDQTWPIEIVAKYCTTDQLPCGGVCCTECDTSCGACVKEALTCPPNPTNNCSVVYKNTADGCCFISVATTCPYQAGTCSSQPQCSAATGQCSYPSNCGNQPGDQPNCYDYTCVAPPAGAADPNQWVCKATPKPGLTETNCTRFVCQNNAIVGIPKYNCTSDFCYTRACVNSQGSGCVITATTASPEPGNRCLSCNVTTSSWVNLTCSSSGDLCKPNVCDPSSGICVVKPVPCSPDTTYQLCDTAKCVNGVCTHTYKNCTPPPCQQGDPLYNSTGFCVPATGECSFVSKPCPLTPCSCGGVPTCDPTGQCVCLSTCAPTKAPTRSPTGAPTTLAPTGAPVVGQTDAPTSAPTNTPAPTPAPVSQCPTCPTDSCSLYECLDTANNYCNVTYEVNCTDQAVKDGLLNNTCKVFNLTCDLSNGCPSPSLVTCSGGDLCNFVVQDPTFGGCCRTVPKQCEEDNECYTYACDSSDGSCDPTFRCPSDPADLCVVPSCDTNLKCVNTTRTCSEPNTACVTYTCNPSTGGCVPVTRVCDDGNPCTVDSCDEVLGCVSSNITCPTSTDPCDIDLGCNPNTGACDKQTKVCDDKIDCTVDICVSGTGCTFTPDDNFCTSTSPCVVNATCDATQGCVVTPKDCTNGSTTFCTIKLCDESFSSGCTAEPYNCVLNASNTSCSITNCSETLAACETKEQSCFAFLGIVAGIVVAGVVVGAVAAGIIIFGAMTGGAGYAVSQNVHNAGHTKVNSNPLYKHEGKAGVGLSEG